NPEADRRSLRLAFHPRLPPEADVPVFPEPRERAVSVFRSFRATAVSVGPRLPATDVFRGLRIRASTASGSRAHRMQDRLSPIFREAHRPLPSRDEPAPTRR